MSLLEAEKDYMVLSWTEPASNGGADIRGYFVDYRTVKGDVVGMWHEMNHQAVTTNSYKVSSDTFTHTFAQQKLFLTVVCLSRLFVNHFSSSHPLGGEPEGERFLPVPGTCYEHGRCEQSLAAQCSSGVQRVDDHCAGYGETETLTYQRRGQRFLKLPDSYSVQGAPVGLHVLEVRDSSVMVLWEPPAFDGRTPVNGYYVDIKEAAAGVERWRAVHEKANKTKYMKVRTSPECRLSMVVCRSHLQC